MKINRVEKDTQLIIGIHSITAALKNAKRKSHTLMGTDKGLESLRKAFGGKLPQIDIQKLENHKFQESAERLYKEHQFEFKRIPSGLLLDSSKVDPLDEEVFFRETIASQGTWKIVCLDQVTDVHNCAAVMRTSAFFDIDLVVVTGKNFRLSPGFFRVSSGGAEFVPILNTNSLSKFVKKIKKAGIPLVPLDETGDDISTFESSDSFCLISGQEDLGLSNAVKFNCGKLYKLNSFGPIETLNVSIATSVALTKIRK
ncbi:hypothetical protein N9N67_06775 [Bacteriovoracaceae bacterium]|nr:hypothetical protein [Bacteriovoracaceae bacterium]